MCNKKIMNVNQKVKVLIMDVDGTLTDGGIYIGNYGEKMKRFDVKDGYGIHEILPKIGITPVIITGKSSQIVEVRCKELGITKLIQGSNDKVSSLKKIVKELKVEVAQVAYIGDDINDYEAMKMVGIKGCPNNAVLEIKNISDYVTKAEGGYGAVREFIEWIRYKYY